VGRIAYRSGVDGATGFLGGYGAGVATDAALTVGGTLLAGTEWGATIGTFIGGPIGTGVGAILGGLVGGMIAAGAGNFIADHSVGSVGHAVDNAVHGVAHAWDALVGSGQQGPADWTAI
jgi:hypothetical protein